MNNNKFNKINFWNKGHCRRQQLKVYIAQNDKHNKSQKNKMEKSNIKKTNTE